MTVFQVDQVKLRTGDDLAPHQRIEGLGGKQPHPWFDTEEKIIESLNNCTKTFYTIVRGKRAWIIPGFFEERLYLKTDLDQRDPQKLLDLPQVP